MRKRGERWENVGEGLALIAAGLLLLGVWPFIGILVIALGVCIPRRK